MNNQDYFDQAMEDGDYIGAAKLACEFSSGKSAKSGAWGWADDAVSAAARAGLELHPGSGSYPNTAKMLSEIEEFKSGETYTLCSTVVAPSFRSSTIHVEGLTPEQARQLLALVNRNLCGHPVTSAVLSSEITTLPTAEKGFWDGTGKAIAARPRGGARGASSGDTQVTFSDLEFCKFWIE